MGWRAKVGAGDITIIPYPTILKVPLAEALRAGGASVLEIVFRTDAAEEALRAIASAVPSLLVGAGTILSVAQAIWCILCTLYFVLYTSSLS